MLVPKDQQSDVDVLWLAEAGAGMGGPGTPRFPLVVGGSGMVGCSLIVLLANTPGVERIRVLDRMPPRKAVLADSPELQKKLDFVQHKLCLDSEEELLRAFDGIDCVFSCITPNVQDGTAKEFHRTNVTGIKMLVDASIAAQVPRFVFLSSIAVTNHFVHSNNMSEREGLPDIDTLISPYDVSKRQGEDLVLAANGKNGLATVSLRAGGIVVSPTDYTFRNYFIVPGVIFKISHNGRIDFIAVQDVVRGMLMAAKSLQTSSAAHGEAFFLTKGDAVTTSEQIEFMADVLGWQTFLLPDPFFEFCLRSQHLFHQLKDSLGFTMPGIPPHWYWKMGRIDKNYDNSKIRDILGFTPVMTFDRSMRRICEMHMRSLRSRTIPWHLMFIRPMPAILCLLRMEFWLSVTACVFLLTLYRKLQG